MKNIIFGYNWYFDHFIIPSIAYYQKLKNKKIENVHFLPQFINVENWKENKKDGIGKKLLYVGRLEEDKGILFLVKVFNRLRLVDKTLTLDIVRDGSCYESIEKLINTLKLEDKVNLLGFKGKKEIEDFYSESALLIFPTIKGELFGLVGLEAQASKLPVVASNLDGIKEWCIDGYTGITFQANNELDLQEKILAILSNKQDYQNLQTNGYQYIQDNFSYEAAFNKILNLYQKIIRVEK